MNKYQDPKTRHYTSEFKMRVINSVLSEGLSYVEAAAQFEVTNESTVRGWVKQFRGNKLSLSIDSFIPMSRLKDEDKSKEELVLKLRALEKQLEEEKFKNKVLNTLIDVVDKQLDIDIRKKGGTKQSK